MSDDTTTTTDANSEQQQQPLQAEEDEQYDTERDLDSLKAELSAVERELKILVSLDDQDRRAVADHHKQLSQLQVQARNPAASESDRKRLSEEVRKIMSAFSMKQCRTAVEKNERGKEVRRLNSSRTQLQMQIRRKEALLKAGIKAAERNAKQLERDQRAEQRARDAEERNKRLAQLKEHTTAVREAQKDRMAEVYGEDYAQLSPSEKQERVRKVMAERAATAMMMASTNATSSNNGMITMPGIPGPAVAPIDPISNTGSSSSSSSAVAGAAAAAASSGSPPSSPSSPTDPFLQQALANFPRQFIFDSSDLEVLNFIASGGGGSVYKVRIRSIDRIVAGKTFTDRSQIEKSVKEIELGLRLNHRNIVQTVGVCIMPRVDGRGSGFELMGLMELGDGTLATLLKAAAASSASNTNSMSNQQQQQGDGTSAAAAAAAKADSSSSSSSSDDDTDSSSDGENHNQESSDAADEPQHNLPFDICLDYALQVAEGLAYLHDKDNKPAGRVLVLDLKPQNIIITSGKVLKLIDFGLARSMSKGNDATSTDVTSLGQGTLRFLAPEAMTTTKTKATHDIYSYGAAILYWLCVVGKEPHGTNPTPLKILRSNLAEQVVPRPGCPPSLTQLCKDCLDLNPNKRPKDGKVLVDRLNICINEFHQMQVAAQQQQRQQLTASTSFGSFYNGASAAAAAAMSNGGGGEASNTGNSVNTTQVMPNNGSFAGMPAPQPSSALFMSQQTTMMLANANAEQERQRAAAAAAGVGSASTTTGTTTTTGAGVAADETQHIDIDMSY